MKLKVNPPNQALARPLHGESQGAVYSPRLDFRLILNKAVGIARRVRVGQFQLPYVLPAA